MSLSKYSSTPGQMTIGQDLKGKILEALKDSVYFSLTSSEVHDPRPRGLLIQVYYYWNDTMLYVRVTNKVRRDIIKYLLLIG